MRPITWLLGSIAALCQWLKSTLDRVEGLFELTLAFLCTLSRLPASALARIRGAEELAFSEHVESSMAAVLFRIKLAFYCVRVLGVALGLPLVTDWLFRLSGLATWIMSVASALPGKVLARIRGTEEEAVLDALEVWTSVVVFFATLPYYWLTNLLAALEERQQTTKLNGFVSVVSWCLLTPVFFVVYTIVQACDFANRWARTRNLDGLIRGIPAIALGASLIPVFVLTEPESFRTSRIRHYRQTLASAVDEEDSALTQVCLEKLQQLDYERADVAEFATLRRLAEGGHHREAYEVAKALAPINEPGYVYAHIWICETLLQGHVEEVRKWEVLAAHWRHANRLEPDHPLVKRHEIELCLHEGRSGAVKELMESIVDLYPRYHVRLVEIHSREGNLLEANLHAKAAVRFFTELAEKDEKSLTPADYDRWAACCRMTGERSDELLVLVDAFEQFPRQDDVRQRFRKLIEERLQDVSLNVVDAQRLLTSAPENETVWRPMLQHAARGDSSARDAVEQLRSKGVLPPGFFMRLGDMHFSQSEFAVALRYYEIVCNLDQEAAIAWNNVAWILANIEPRDLDRALRSATRAVELLPDPRLFETRGQILMRLKRFDEAVPDLLQAANGDFPELGDVHRSLASAYRHLGQMELSAAHASWVQAP